MMSKKKYKKGELKEQIAIEISDIVLLVGELTKYESERVCKTNVSEIAVMMYDLNRMSAHVLSMLKSMGFRIKMDINFMDTYADDPFIDEDFSSKIDLKNIDLAE